MQTILFLCTGNYFRSRFAEQLFNHIAQAEALPWVAESRALRPIALSRNPGSISVYTLEALRQRGIAPRSDRNPMDLTEADLRRAARIIAAKETEHRPLARTHFPDWEQKIEYWHCHDLDCATATDALNAVEARVKEVLAGLR